MFSYTANEYSIYHFCIMTKDFSISFSRVIIVQDFETITFCVICIQTEFLCYFLLNEKAARFKLVQQSFHPIHFYSQTCSLVRCILKSR